MTDDRKQQILDRFRKVATEPNLLSAVRVPTSKMLTGRDNLRQCVEMRKRGMSTPDIADALGISTTQVMRTLKVAMAEYVAAGLLETEEILALQSMRLDTLLNAVWDAAEGGDLEAVKTALKLIESERRMLGLDKHGLEPGPGVAAAQVQIYLPDNGRGPAPTVVDAVPMYSDEETAEQERESNP